MKKLIFAILAILHFTAYSQHCPQPENVVIKQNGQYIPVAPTGWRWAASWGEPKFNSSNIKLNWAMWSSSRINAEDENRVQCIYGNPVFDGNFGGVLQTVQTVDREMIENQPGWHLFGENYFRCKNSDVLVCSFADNKVDH